MSDDKDPGQAGRRIALVVAGTGVFWMLAVWLGGKLGLDNRTRALFDLIALAGFGMALWMTYQLWRSRQDDER